MEKDKIPLLEEIVIFDYSVNEEVVGNQKRTYLRGLFQHAGVRNGNGRVYPYSILESEIRNNQEKISKRQMLGELNHPKEGSIHLEKVSHCITKLDLNEDGRVTGEVEVFDGPDEAGGTPNGRILGSLIKRKVLLGISSRGFGTTKNISGVNEVQKDFKLVTFDIVSDPSTPNAYPEAVCEDKDLWYHEEKSTKNVSDLIKENLED
jgi:hypothetical protein